MQRRNLVLGLVSAAIGAVATGISPGARAQRPAQPIARPPGQRLAGALVAGRFDNTGGVAAGATPGVYTVVSVDTKGDTLQLRDEGGRTGTVHVSEHTFDLATLKPGEEVEVDFVVPEPGRTTLEAGGIWKVQR